MKSLTPLGAVAGDARWPSRMPAECEWHSPEASVDVEVGWTPRRVLHWTEQAKHTVLLLRLQRPYFVYCLACSLLAAAAFLSTLCDLVWRRAVGRSWLDILEGGTWQSACWTAVALALCAEVASAAVVRGRGLRGLAEDWWYAFDTAVVVLTVLAWALMRVRRASPMREEAEEADLWLLTLRFALQPCRVLATAKMARKVQQMQESHMDVNFDVLAEAAQGPDQSCAGEPFPRTAACLPFEASALKGRAL